MIGIIGAMDMEIDLVKKKMTDLEVETIAGNTYYLGKIDGKELALVRSGIGKVNASIATQILIDRYKADMLINIGIAGAVDKDLKHLDMIVSDRVTYHDFDHDIMTNHFPFKTYFEADKDLIKKVCSAAERIGKTARIGTIVTGDGFISSTDYKLKLQEDFQALCVEMEGGAIGHTSSVNDVPFVIIRTISDLADDSGDEDYEVFAEDAANIAANLIIDIINHL